MVRNAGGKIRSIKVYDFDTTFFEFSSNLFRDSVHVEGYQSQTRRVSGKLFRFLERYESDKSPRVTPFTESLLSQSRNLKYIKIRSTLPLREMEMICESATLLEHFELGLDAHSMMSVTCQPGRFPSLKTLGITTALRLAKVSDLFDWFCNLQEIKFTYVGVRTGPTTFFIRNVQTLNSIRVKNSWNLTNVSYRAQNLTSIELVALPHLITIQDSPGSQYLTEIIIQDVPSLPKDQLFRFFQNPRYVSILTLSSPQFEAIDVEPFFRESMHLKYVDINSLRSMNDSTLKLLHSQKRLEELYVDDCPGITGNGIIQLVENLSVKCGGKLSKISIGGNESIRRQTVDWARTKGVVIWI